MLIDSLWSEIAPHQLVVPAQHVCYLRLQNFALAECKCKFCYVPVNTCYISSFFSTLPHSSLSFNLRQTPSLTSFSFNSLQFFSSQFHSIHTLYSNFLFLLIKYLQFSISSYFIFMREKGKEKRQRCMIHHQFFKY